MGRGLVWERGPAVLQKFLWLCGRTLERGLCPVSFLAPVIRVYSPTTDDGEVPAGETSYPSQSWPRGPFLVMCSGRRLLC